MSLQSTLINLVTQDLQFVCGELATMKQTLASLSSPKQNSIKRIEQALTDTSLVDDNKENV
jgi:hypothetical protein